MATETMKQKIYDRAYQLAESQNKGHVLFNFFLAYGQFLSDNAIFKIVDKAFFDNSEKYNRYIYGVL